ncbi:MAG: hypothetical protein COB93_10610 [Sneathiella sp.]|nr:MAG: hypothetical protein COB93_10610 [Sneathiella sp.]
MEALQKGAWRPDQVIDWMMGGLRREEFYILCPDNEVSPEIDRKRILWAATDITENRLPLSRWHGGYDNEYEQFNPDKFHNR